MNKLNKEQLDIVLEIGMVVALMSNDGRMERLYKKIHDEGEFGGICDTAYVMAWFATEFVEKHLSTDWEQLFNLNETDDGIDKFLHLSDKFKAFGKFSSHWDEAVEDYAEWRIDNFNFEEFEKINYNQNS